MDRPITYIGAVPRSVDILNTNRNAMVALGFVMQAVLGTNVSVEGLLCTPNSPADMTVRVSPGAIHSLQNVDGTAYGTLPADTTRQVMKQGLSESTVSFGCAAPVTTGHSIVYLVQAAYQDQDAGGAVLPYYNASNPSVPWAGPNNTGVSQNTVRKGACLLGVKAGISATTGTQATPSPDAGYVGLYAVTVANGQTTITSGNIARLASAPFIDAKLPAMLATIQSGAVTFAQDTSGAANTITVALSPVPAALTNGQRIAVKVANSVTGATVLNVNGLGNVAVVTTSGAAMSTNAMVANGIYTLVYDANGTRWQLQGFTAATATGLLPANNLSDVSNAATALANIGGTIPTGIMWPAARASAPTGWLLCSGLTIGSASSGATGRANADTQSLFNVLWADFADAEIPIFTSAGGASARGASAAADWAANKRMSLPDMQDRTFFGRGNMSGTPANRVTVAGSGIDSTTLGATGGSQFMQQHTHTATVTDPGHAHGFSTGTGGGTGAFDNGIAPAGSGSTNTATTGISVSNANTGAGSSQNMPPGFFGNWIIKL